MKPEKPKDRIWMEEAKDTTREEWEAWDEFYKKSTPAEIEAVERQFRWVPEEASLDLPHERQDINNGPV